MNDPKLIEDPNLTCAACGCVGAFPLEEEPLCAACIQERGSSCGCEGADTDDEENVSDPSRP